MRIFLDTASIDEIQKGVNMGVVSGVTTNPTLVAAVGCRSYRELVTRICAVTPGDVSAEVVREDAGGMVEQAVEMSSWASNVVIKIPASVEGLTALGVLSGRGIRVNMTLCFTLNQAILAASAGAAYVSPFVGRLDDVGEDGMGVVANIVRVFDHYGYPTRVLAASIRHPNHVLKAAEAGAHVITMPYKVLMQMVKHPLTDTGIERFMSDWKSSGAVFD